MTAKKTNVVSMLSDNRMAIAKHHDSKMRDLEKQAVANWADQAQCALAVLDQSYWRDLGFRDWEEWLNDAAPQSASYTKANISIVRELKDDISAEQLKRIPHKTAKVLAKGIPKNMRKKPEMIAKAQRMKPEKFVRDVQKNHPELHIETLVKRQYGFSKTQDEMVEGAVQLYRVVEDKPDATREEAMEGFASQYILEHIEEWNEIKADFPTVSRGIGKGEKGKRAGSSSARKQ